MKKLLTILVSLTLITAAGCGSDNQNNPGKKDPCQGLTTEQCGVKKAADKKPVEDLKKEALQTYAKIAFNSYGEALKDAKKLQTAINAFAAAPDQAKLDAARQAWRDSRPKYLETEVYRFYDGPINKYVTSYTHTVTLDGLKDDDDIEGFVNPWPLDESYIDYTEDGQGHRNATTFALSLIGNETAYNLAFLQDKAKIRSRNEGDPLAGQNGAKPGASQDDVKDQSEKNLSTGYHAIEFMLWGQDFNDNGPGNRPLSDFITSPSNKYAERRLAYLKTVTDILVDDLTWVHEQWDTSKTNNYVTSYFLKPENQDKVFQAVIGGMKELSINETGGERIVAAYNSGNQEDEHSCFSDNTPVDFIEDVQGLINVWRGTYTGEDSTNNVSGTGLRDVIYKLDATAASGLGNLLEKALKDASTMVDPNKPNEKYFDQLINKKDPNNPNPGRPRVLRFAQDLYNTRVPYKAIYTALGDNTYTDGADGDELPKIE